jgi:hypothetical protein
MEVIGQLHTSDVSKWTGSKLSFRPASGWFSLSLCVCMCVCVYVCVCVCAYGPSSHIAFLLIVPPQGAVYSILLIFFTIAQQPPVGQGLLIIEDSQSHSDTPRSVGLLWTSDQPDAETSAWQHTTLSTDKRPCCRRDTNPQSQPSSGRRPTP